MGSLSRTRSSSFVRVDQQALPRHVGRRVLGQPHERVARVAERKERLAVGRLLSVVLLELDLIFLPRALVDEEEPDAGADDDWREGVRSEFSLRMRDEIAGRTRTEGNEEGDDNVDPHGGRPRGERRRDAEPACSAVVRRAPERGACSSSVVGHSAQEDGQTHSLSAEHAALTFLVAMQSLDVPSQYAPNLQLQSRTGVRVSRKGETVEETSMRRTCLDS